MPRTAPEFALAIVLAFVGVMVLIGLALLMASVFMLGGFWIVIAFFCFGRGRGPWGGHRSLPGARPPYGRAYYTRRSVYGPRRL